MHVYIFFYHKLVRYKQYLWSALLHIWGNIRYADVPDFKFCLLFFQQPCFIIKKCIWSERVGGGINFVKERSNPEMVQFSSTN